MINHVISVAKYSVSVNTLNPVFPKKTIHYYYYVVRSQTTVSHVVHSHQQ